MKGDEERFDSPPLEIGWADQRKAVRAYCTYSTIHANLHNTRTSHHGPSETSASKISMLFNAAEFINCKLVAPNFLGTTLISVDGTVSKHIHHDRLIQDLPSNTPHVTCHLSLIRHASVFWQLQQEEPSPRYGRSFPGAM